MELVRECNSDAERDDPNRIVGTTLLHPPDTKISCFFDLAKILEESSSLELGEMKSITLEESYRSEIFLGRFERKQEI